MKLVINGSSINVEHADDHAARQLGLMYRNFLPTDSGMLFSFPDSAERSFWMKNTYIPLSIAYIDADGTILNIEDLEPQDPQGIPSTGSAMFALEMNRNWFKDRNINAGDIVQGLLADRLSLVEGLEFDLSNPSFHYTEVSGPIKEEILTALSDGFQPAEFTNSYIWEYPIAPEIWAENYEGDGAAFFDVNVEIIPVDFEADHPGWNIDATAGYGESAEAAVDIKIQFRPGLQMTSSVLKDFTRELSNVIPHEIHHLTQHGKPFERPNCPVLLPAEGESFFQYFTQSCEVPAFLIGFRSEASESGLAIEKLIDSYLNNYIKVGKINKDESSKIKDVWLGHESWDVEEVNERLIREYIRRILLEVTSLPAQYYKKIDDAIAASQFWEESNEQAEVDIYGDNEMLSTPAIEKLRVAVQEAVNDLGMNVDIQMSSNPNGGMYNLHPGHPAWPNRWIVDAKWYISKQKPGQSTVDVEFLTSDPEILDEFDSAALVRHIAQTIRHELVHYEQMKKQAEKKDIGEIQAFQEMLDDPTQIPSDNDPKYWEVYEPTGKFDNEDPPSEIIHKEGYKHDVYVKDYLRSHIEIDAHAHDGAEELLAVYGKEDSLDMLRYGFDLEDPQLPNAIRHYWEQLSDDDPTLNKIKKKLYTQIMSLSSQQSDDVD